MAAPRVWGCGRWPLGTWVASIFLVTAAAGHPQCLDYEPPFEVTGGFDGYCDDYAQSGCCTLQQSRNILTTLQKTQATALASTACAPFLRNVSCLSCHPWSQHIFSGVPRDRNGTEHPQLCKS